MKLLTKSFCLIFIVLILYSCETKDDKLCREQLSSTVRQLNALFENFYDSKAVEESFLIQENAKDFYSSIINHLMGLRNELAKQKITPRFSNYNKLIKQVISSGIKYFSSRQELMLNLLEPEMGYGYFSEKTYLESMKEMQVEIKKLVYYSDSLNNIRSDLNILNFLHFQSVILDTTDYFYISPKDLENRLSESERDWNESIKEIEKEFEKELEDAFRQFERENNMDSTQGISKIEVEDVRLVKEYPNAWTVKGMIRNNDSKNIKGWVKIKLVNSKGDIVHSFNAYVNDGDPIEPGQAGFFSYTTTPSDFNDITDYRVIFYEK